VGSRPRFIESALSSGVHATAFYRRMPELEGLVTSDVAEPHLHWSAPTVGEWLASLGLALYSQKFVEHEVTGDLLEVMDKEDLRDLGVTLVGHRLKLLRAVAALQQKSESESRSKMLWQADEVLHRDGPLGWLSFYLSCKSCVKGTSKYKLTGRAMVLARARTALLARLAFGCRAVPVAPAARRHLRTAHPSRAARVPRPPLQEILSREDRNLCSFSEPSTTTRSIELGNVVGVRYQHRSAPCDCCCGCTADDVFVELNHEIGLPPVAPLAVRSGSGEQVAHLIQGAMEAAHGLHGLHGGTSAQAAHGSPVPQAMVRSASNVDLRRQAAALRA